MRIRREFPALAAERVRAELVRRLISAMILDVVEESRQRLAKLNADSADAVRHAGAPSVGLSPPMKASEAEIKATLYRDVYRHPRVTDVMAGAEHVVERLFGQYLTDVFAMPEAWRPAPSAGDSARARTDRKSVV